MPTPPTRAQYYGIKAKQLTKQSTTKLLAMRAKIGDMAMPLQEADAALQAQVEKTTAALDSLIKSFQDSADYMNEPFEN